MDTSCICPNCGGEFIRAGETAGGFSVGKAVAGQLAFGSIGIAAGLSGSKQIILRCKKCGYTKNVSSSEADRITKSSNFQSTLHGIERDYISSHINNVGKKIIIIKKPLSNHTLLLLKLYKKLLLLSKKPSTR